MMQDLLKRHFWIVGALAVLGCSFFAAKTAGHIIEEKALGDAAVGPKVTPAAPKAAAVAPTRNKDGKPLSDRNMFCSACSPVGPAVAAAPTDPSQIPGTSLPLVLIATNVGKKAEH